MYELLMAVLLVCGSPDGEKCITVNDKLGYVSSVQTCHRRLDMMWERIEANPKAIVDIASIVGPFKIKTYFAHRGLCINLKSGSLADQIENRYGL